MENELCDFLIRKNRRFLSISNDMTWLSNLLKNKELLSYIKDSGFDSSLQDLLLFKFPFLSFQESYDFSRFLVEKIKNS